MISGITDQAISSTTLAFSLSPTWSGWRRRYLTMKYTISTVIRSVKKMLIADQANRMPSTWGAMVEADSGKSGSCCSIGQAAPTGPG